MEWTKVKCTKCKSDKHCRQDRYDKLKEDNRIDTYICRNCKLENN